MNQEFDKIKKQERHNRAEWHKLQRLMIEADPAALKDKKERQAGLMTAALAVPLCAGLILGAHSCNPKTKAAKTVSEQPRVEQTVDAELQK